MDALLMCGGRGTRLDADVEKPLLEVGGRPMVERVLDALAASGVGAVHAVTSPHVPETGAFLEARSESVVETPGAGYVADLDRALERVEPPVLTVVADLPLLSGDAIDRVRCAHDGGSLTVAVPAAVKRVLGASVGTTFDRDGRELSPTGLNVVADSERETTIVTHDVRLAVNVNRDADARIAERLV